VIKVSHSQGVAVVMTYHRYDYEDDLPENYPEIVAGMMASIVPSGKVA
jgi:hypothetical protein